jgi:prolyl-tRNA synthetase
LTVSLDQLVNETATGLEKIQRAMLDRARTWLLSVTTIAQTLDEFRQNLAEKPGFVKVHWCGSQECENRLIDETKTTPRNMPLHEPEKPGKCIICGKDTTIQIYYARTY